MQDTEQWFTALYEQNASKMLRYASYQLRNASIAEELVEEAFVRLLQRREELWAVSYTHLTLPTTPYV